MATPTCGPPIATPTRTCALAVVGASARQVSNALAHNIHLNPRILEPRLRYLRLPSVQKPAQLPGLGA